MDGWTSTQMRCVRCGNWWEVIEAGTQWLDPERYVCPDDRQPVAGQLELDDAGRVDRPGYDPDQAAIPF